MKKDFYKIIFFLIVTLLTIGIISASDNTTQITDIEDTTSEPLDNIQKQSTSDNTPSDTINKKITNNTKQSQKRIILNSTTFNDYVTDGQFNEKVNTGDVIDVQGLLNSKSFGITVNKSVNITSTTGDAQWGADEKMTFKIIKGGSGTNVTNINFYQTHIDVFNTTNIILDNITNRCNRTYFGTVNSVGGISQNIKILNSYFYSECVDTWAPNLKVSGIDGILIENSTFIQVGDCMNNLYVQIAYNMEDVHKISRNITVRNCLFDGTRAISQAASCGLVLQGSDILIENSTIKHNSSNTLFGENYLVMGVWIDLNYGTNNTGELLADNLVDGLVFRYNKLYNGHINFGGFHNSTIYGNEFYNTETWIGNNTVYNNTFSDEIYEDGYNVIPTFSNVKLTLTNSIFKDNIISHNLTILHENHTVTNNTILGSIYINGTNNTIKNNLITQITGNTENNSIQNNEKIISINDNTISDYTIKNSTLILDNITDNTKLFINLYDKTIRNINITSPANNVNITVIGKNIYHIYINPNSQITIINSNIPTTSLEVNAKHTLINSVLLNDVNSSDAILINSTILNNQEKLKIITANTNMDKSPCYDDYFNNNSYLAETVTDNNILLIRNTPENTYTRQMIINKKVNITSWDNATLNADLIFVEGSQGSNLTGMNINSTVYINTSNINLKDNNIKNILINKSSNTLVNNNTLFGLTIQNSEDINITNNKISQTIYIINTTNSNITSNNINTTSENTINIQNSNNNKITNNTLISKDKNNTNTIITDTQNNIINNNLPKAESMVILEVNKNTILTKPYEVNITVVSNNKTVTKGYVIILDNGVQKINQTVTNGKLTTNMTSNTLGEHIIKAIYYPEDNYCSNKSSQTITVRTIDSHMDVETSNNRIYENTTVNITVTDENGDNVDEGEVNLVIKDTNITKTLNNGMASITFYTPENYMKQTMTITYTGISITNITQKATLNPQKGESNVTITYKLQDDNLVISAVATNKIGEKLDGYMQFSSPTSKIVKTENQTATLTVTPSGDEILVKVTFRNNPNYETSTANKTIIINKKTQVTINNINNVAYGENVTVTGKLTDTDNNAIPNANITLTVNTQKINLITDSSGEYKYITNATTVGLNNVSVVFAGDKIYEANSSKNSFTVNKQSTKLIVNKVNDSNPTSTISITGTLTDKNGKVISNAPVKITLNNDLFNTTTNKNGQYSFTTKATTVGLNNISISYNGNAYYTGSALKTTFNVIAFNTKINEDKVSDIVYGQQASISGKLTTTSGVVLANTWLQVTVNNKTSSFKTDKKGQFNASIKNSLPGVNNVTISYAGNNTHKSSNITTSYNMNPMETRLVINTIKSVSWGEMLTITGILSDKNSNPLKNSLEVNLNGQTLTIRSDAKGIFTITTKTNKPVNASITVKFNDNGYYKASEASAKYEVTSRNTVIKFNPISSVSWGDTVSITGTFRDVNGNLFKNTALSGNVNGGKTFKVKTDANGVFTITTKTNKPLNGSVTVFFAGNAYYNKTSAESSYEITPRNTSFTINTSTASYGSDIQITGIFMDEYGNVFKNSAVDAKLNGKTFKVKTDANGKFVINTRVNTLGVNNLTMSFIGNSKYKATSKTVTFNVIQAKTKITINKIVDTKKGATVTITGTFKDQNNKVIVNSALKGNINGNTFTVKTNDKGVFTVTTRANTVGVNNITITYPGSAYYQSTNNSATFKVST